MSVRPSASVTDTNRPPGSPFFSGRTETLTSSPGLTVVAFHPAAHTKAKEVVGLKAPVQIHHLPCSFTTSTSIHECGFLPAEGLDRALELHHLRAVDAGRGVVRRGRRGGDEQDGERGKNSKSSDVPSIACGGMCWLRSGRHCTS